MAEKEELAAKGMSGGRMREFSFPVSRRWRDVLMRHAVCVDS